VFGHPERREGPLSPSLDKRQVNRCAQDAEERAQANAVHGMQRPLARLAGIGVSAETARDSRLLITTRKQVFERT
jgi:hypothetical protein